MKSLWWVKKGLISSLIGCTLLASVGCYLKPKNLQINISAASSLTEPLKEIVQLYEKEKKGLQINLNFGGTSTLKNQILEGAQVDLFLSASTQHYEDLVEKKYIETGKILGRSEVVLIAPTSNEKVKCLEDLTHQDVKILLAEKEVPIGRYSEEVLTSAESLYGEGFKQKVMQQVVSREHNVKQVLNKVMMGEADCGFVYQTDVVGEAEKKVKIIPLPESCKVQSTYWIGLLANSLLQEEAKLFYDFIDSRESQAIWQRYGWK